MARAADFYVDPENGDMSGDGSASAPWSTLQEVVDAGLIEIRMWDALPYESSSHLEAENPGARVQPGDTICLRSGCHGNVEIIGAYNAETIPVEADGGDVPRLGRLLVRSASGWIFGGLVVGQAVWVSRVKGTLEAHCRV